MKNIFLFFGIIGTAFAAARIPRAEFKWATLDGKPTLLMGHRGEKVIMPEHTLGSYEIASIESAEYVEPDLVLSKDGELVCFHDLTLKASTDVSSRLEFADRMRSWEGWLENDYTIIKDNWFIQDFTVPELRTLRVKQAKVGIRPQHFNEVFWVPTFKEYLDVIRKMSYKLKKPIGIIPELKHPTFNNNNFNARYMERKLLENLKEYGYPLQEGDTPACKYIDETGNSHDIPCGDLIIQSFDENCIQYFSELTNRDLMVLVDDNIPLLTRDGLKNVSTYAQYYGIFKEFLYVSAEEVLKAMGREYRQEEVDAMGGFVPANTFVADAHALGLKMSIYTIYDSREPSRRGCARGCDPENKTAEVYYYFRMGVDGMFVENIPEARELRLRFEYEDQFEGTTEIPATIPSEGIKTLRVDNLQILWISVVITSLNFCYALKSGPNYCIY